MMILKFLSLQALVLFFFSTLVHYAFAPPYKRREPVAVDLTGDVPDYVRVRKSLNYPGASYYTIKRGFLTSHKLGDVTDAGDVIYPENPDELERFLMVMDLPGCVRYLRVVSKVKGPRNKRRRIVEFTTNPGDYKFYQIVRIPVTLNLPIQKTTDIIKMEEDISSMTRTFTIQPKVKHRFVIGTIRYNRRIVMGQTNDLLDRQVIWERSDEPSLTVISIYGDGDCVVEKLQFSMKEKRFLTVSRDYTKVFLKPKDEFLVVDGIPMIESKANELKPAQDDDDEDEDDETSEGDGHTSKEKEEDEDQPTSWSAIQQAEDPARYVSEESTTGVSLSSSDMDRASLDSNEASSSLATDPPRSYLEELTDEQYRDIEDIEFRMNDQYFLDYLAMD